VDPKDGLDNLEKRKFLTLPGLELQSVASRAIDYAIPAIIAVRIKGNKSDIFSSQSLLYSVESFALLNPMCTHYRPKRSAL
jgi:hypothetical protein